MICPPYWNEDTGRGCLCPARCYKDGPQHPLGERDGSETAPSESGAEVKSPVNPRVAGTSEELPAWRLELTKRLETLKKRNRTGDSAGPVQEGPDASAPKIVRKDRGIPASTPPSAADAGARTQKSPPGAQSGSFPANAPRQKTILPLEEKVFRTREPDHSGDIRDLIDSAVYRQATQSIPEASVHPRQTAVDQENKFILLSRTLSGLIDLIIVVLCTAALIIAADSFAGIVVLDRISVVEYAVLFLMIFFMYSIFFLTASGQTVGMMITDLRVIGMANSRPSVSQLFARCFGYLLSVIVLGVGLFYSFFDRKNRCLHDRLSDTSVIRIQ